MNGIDTEQDARVMEINMSHAPTLDALRDLHADAVRMGIAKRPGIQLAKNARKAQLERKT